MRARFASAIGSSRALQRSGHPAPTSPAAASHAASDLPRIWGMTVALLGSGREERGNRCREIGVGEIGVASFFGPLIPAALPPIPQEWRSRPLFDSKWP